jgi:hypothetical protein
MVMNGTHTHVPQAPPGGSSLEGSTQPSAIHVVLHRSQQVYQTYLDKSTPQTLYRWIGWSISLLIYLLRVFYFVEGFYIVTYAMAIFNLNLLLGFLTPLDLPMNQDDDEGPGLPSKSNDEFRPFVRRLPEFKFWYASFRSIWLGTCATFFPFLDVPVFWPILVMYWFILFFVTMKRQIKHMIKYKYIPFSFGKRTYDSGKGGKLGGK